MNVEIFSDTVCPWCYVGKKRLELALRQRPDVPRSVRWLAFELNPDLPEEGVEREQYLAAKFGDPGRLHGMQAQLCEIGAGLGIEFRFDLIRKMPNSRASHAMLAFAADHGCQNEASEALFAAYFEAGRDVGDRNVLVELGAAQGLHPVELRRALEERRYDDAIRAEQQQAHEWGISGVPMFIFDRRYAVSGAQTPEVFVQVFDRLHAAARIA